MSYKEEADLVRTVEKDIDALILEGVECSETDTHYNKYSICNEDSHTRYTIKRGDNYLELLIVGKYYDYEITKYFIIPLFMWGTECVLNRIYKKLKKLYNQKKYTERISRIHAVKNMINVPRKRLEETECLKKK